MLFLSMQTELQMSEIEKVKARIRALVNMTPDNGASETEALFAMKKAGELLLQYNLSMDMVTLREEPCVTKHYQSRTKQRDSIWYAYSGLQKLCGVKVWMSRTPSGVLWSFFGLECDVDMAIHLCAIVTDAEKGATAAFKKSDTYARFMGHKKIATNNFLIGFGQRINERLIGLANEQRKAEQAAHAHHAEEMKDRGLTASDEAYKARGTGLICIAKEQKIEEEFKARGPKLTTVKSYSKSRYNPTARDAGHGAANNVNLNRPIGGGSKVAGYL
jgi:hypothetical protein